MHPTLPRYITCITVIPIITLLFFTYHFAFYKAQEIYGENNIIENIQVILLIITTVICLVISILFERWKSYFALPLALLCFSFLLREIDTERLDLPTSIIMMTSGSGRTLLLVTLWLSTIYCLLVNNTLFRAALKCFIHSLSMRLLCLCALCLVISYLFDKHASDFIYRTVIEETSEICAYYILCLSALTLPSSMSYFTNTDYKQTQDFKPEYQIKTHIK